MSGTSANRVSRRQVLSGAAKVAALAVTGTGGLAAPALAQQSKDRIILAMSQEPVQFNPLLYVNTGTENVPESCMFDALWDVNENGEFIPNLATAVPSRGNGGISPDGLNLEGHPQARREVERRPALHCQGRRVHLSDHHQPQGRGALARRLRLRSRTSRSSTTTRRDGAGAPLYAVHLGLAEHAHRAERISQGRGGHQHGSLQQPADRHRPLHAEDPRRRQPHDLRAQPRLPPRPGQGCAVHP